jgi:hypothetical protein
MKRLIALSILLVFVIGTPMLLFAKKEKGEDKTYAQFCMANGNLGYRSLGECVAVLSSCNRPGNTGPECACEEFLNNDPQGFYVEYNSFAECISHLRDGFVSE